MRKIILFILLIVLSSALKAQTKTLLPPVGGANTIYRIGGGFIVDSVDYSVSKAGIPLNNMLPYMAARRGAATAVDTVNDVPYWYSPSLDGWYTVAGGGGTDTATLDGGPFTTSNVQISFNPGVHVTPKQILQAVFYGFQPPTASLTGGTTLELTSAGTVSQTLNWGGGRGTNTPVLSSIIITGNAQTFPQTFSQPALNGTVTGTQIVNVPANTTTVYTNTVTSSSGQTATATTTFNFLGKKYYGLLDDTTGITTGSLNSTIISLNPTFASTKVLGIPTPVNTGAITGTKFWVYAYPATLGDLAALSFNSIPALEAMNKITLSITNASGFTQNYTVYYNKQGQTISSDISAQ